MDEFTEINITPFTDVLLVLLIIFMVMAALIAPAGFEKRFSCGCGLPSHAAAPPKAELVIARNGRMALDGRNVDEHTIYAAMNALHAAKRNITLSIYGDRDTEYAHVIRAMDAAKAAHIANVSFVTI